MVLIDSDRTTPEVVLKKILVLGVPCSPQGSASNLLPDLLRVLVLERAGRVDDVNMRLACTET